MYYLASTVLFALACGVCVLAIVECDRAHLRSSDYAKARGRYADRFGKVWRSRL